MNVRAKGKAMEKKRCPWVIGELYTAYHDLEWGRPVHDDQKLFEMLVLEGAQAGLSWITVLKKREAYRQAFAGFDPRKVARFEEAKINRLLQNPGIIRNQLKIRSAVTNARAFLKVQKEFTTFDRYIWQFTGYQTLHNHYTNMREIPAQTRESNAMSKDMKKRGFSFVGSTICYAFMQAVGMVNDHLQECFCYLEEK